MLKITQGVDFWRYPTSSNEQFIQLEHLCPVRKSPSANVRPQVSVRNCLCASIPLPRDPYIRNLKKNWPTRGASAKDLAGEGGISPKKGLIFSKKHRVRIFRAFGPNGREGHGSLLPPLATSLAPVSPCLRHCVYSLKSFHNENSLNQYHDNFFMP